jgi:hypothetical protein
MDETDVRINRIKLAFAIAIIADLMEFPVIWLESFGWDSVVLFGRAIGVVLDACVMFILSKLLGFHWAFVPSFVLEVIPTLDMFPSSPRSIPARRHHRRECFGCHTQSPERGYTASSFMPHVV